MVVEEAAMRAVVRMMVEKYIILWMFEWLLRAFGFDCGCWCGKRSLMEVVCEDAITHLPFHSYIPVKYADTPMSFYRKNDHVAYDCRD